MSSEVKPWSYDLEPSEVHPGEHMILNMGPHHPSTHGVLRFVIRTDGEVMTVASPDVGFLHRGIEKICEGLTWAQIMPYSDRLDYVAGMCSNWAYALAVEKLLGVEIPRRAELIRIIMAELNRISSHWIGLGCMAMDLGAMTPFPHAIREREYVNDIMEATCGARLTHNYFRIGGLALDVTPEILGMIEEYLDHFATEIVEFNNLITYNKIFRERAIGVTPVTPALAKSLGLVGPNLRAAGVEWDLRRDEPYGLYPELFDLMKAKGDPFVVPTGENGDAYDRYMVRIEETKQSANIVRHALELLKETDGEPIKGAVKRVIKPPAGEAYVRSESARGEMGVWLVSDGKPKPRRIKFRTGSYSAMASVEHLSKGIMIADLVALIASMDIIAPEIDR